MKLVNSKIHIVVLAATLFAFSVCRAQVADDTNGRLYLLCKTWGYVKYFNQNKCFRVWDQYLPGTINEVLAATNNTEFNSATLRFLNQAGNNGVVQNPPAMPDTNFLVNTGWIHDTRFSPEVRGFLDTFTANIHPDQLACLVRINNGTNPRAYGWIDFTQDTIDMTVDYSLVSHRLTTVFYYWNVINYFFPYRNLTDKSWDSILLKYIPLFRQCTTDINFEKMFLKFVANIKDSHGVTNSPLLKNSFWHGSCKPGIAFERIEGQCVVTKVDDIEGILPGDILQTVNGRTVRELEDSIGQFISASNDAVLYREIYSNMIRGDQDTEMELTLTNRQSETYTVITSRKMDATQWYYWKIETAISDPFTTTSYGYGYVNMGKLQPADIPAMYDALKSAPAIIFDLRNYPKGTLWSLVPYLFGAPFSSAIFYMPALAMILAGRPCNYLPGWYYVTDNQNDFGSFTNLNPYSGKVYILVNQETQSQAEYTCQTLSYHPNAKVIGTQTAGADGNITALFLPKGLTTLFTSLGCYYADGYQQQRNGVKIDTIVSPTIAGIREGKDEILQAALDCISGITPQDSPLFSVAVYPNPVSNGLATISISQEQPGKLQFTVADINGKTVKGWTGYYQAGQFTERIDLTDAAPGIYVLKVTNEQRTLIRKIQVD
ncbi:MAG: S41 family peptidase [Bacteroidia bacterium]|nr:S41 family peptidase [Bacteroidia bacterium]